MALGRNMDGCGNFIKYSLFIVNLVICIGGIISVSLGIWIVADQSFANELLGTNLYAGSSYVLILTGLLVTFVSCFGCLGSVKEVRCMLVTYFIALFLIFVTMLVGGIIGFVFREKAETTLHNEMMSSLRFYGNCKPVTDAWSETQTRLKCCGVDSYKDWMDRIPDSCCKPIQGTVQRCNLIETQNDFTLYRRGCLRVTIEHVKENALIIGTVAIIVACIMILGMIFSYALFRLIE